MNEPERTKTAYHEAGHAVVGFYSSIRLKSVFIIKKTHSLGRVPLPKGYHSNFHPDLTQRPFLNDGRGWARIDREIATLMAGACAVWQYTGNETSFEEESSTDYDKIVELASFRCLDLEKELPLYFEWCKARTNVLVSKYWDKIETVAMALLEGGEIKKKEFQKIISPNIIQTGSPQKITKDILSMVKK